MRFECLWLGNGVMLWWYCWLIIIQNWFRFLRNHTPETRLVAISISVKALHSFIRGINYIYVCVYVTINFDHWDKICHTLHFIIYTHIYHIYVNIADKKNIYMSTNQVKGKIGKKSYSWSFNLTWMVKIRWSQNQFLFILLTKE